MADSSSKKTQQEDGINQIQKHVNKQGQTQSSSTTSPEAELQLNNNVC